MWQGRKGKREVLFTNRRSIARAPAEIASAMTRKGRFIRLRWLTGCLEQDANRPPGSPTGRNLSVKFADAAGDAVNEHAPAYDRLKFERTASDDITPSIRPKSLKLRPRAEKLHDHNVHLGDPAFEEENKKHSKHASSRHASKIGGTSDWNHWGASATNVSASAAISNHAPHLKGHHFQDLAGEALRNMHLRHSDEHREAVFKAKVERHEAARNRRVATDFLGGEGRVNPVLHRGLPTPLLEASRPVNPEHMNERDFSKHIRIRERVNNPEKMQELLNEEFDYSTAAESLADKVKKKEKAKMGRRAGGYYGQ